jgi:signal transduction histidine kinase
MKFSLHSVVTAPLKGTLCNGRLFILDHITWSDDDLLLAEIIASRTGIELDRQVLQRQHDEALATRERMRLTRDLHDSILQSLTAATLQLQLSVHDSGEALRKRLSLVQQILGREQSRVRGFVEEMAPKSQILADPVLTRDLESSLTTSARQWGCATSLSVFPENATISRRLHGELSLLFAEALANAARHGLASNVEVAVAKANGELAINIRDNGIGFPVTRPTPGDDQVTIADGRPASLRGRIRALGGSLTVSSSPIGAELDIRIPLS